MSWPFPPKRFERSIITFLSDEEVDAVLATCDIPTWTGRRDQAMFALTIQTGLRISELRSLTCGDVFLGGGPHVHCVGKGRKERKSPLLPRTVDLLRVWLVERSGAPPEPLFPTVGGRTLGGSSHINASGAVRGTPDDYDGWARAGCDGWAWDDVLPAFIRLENDQDFGDRPHHGSTGPIPIERTPMERWGSVANAFAEAAQAEGAAWCDDINSPGSRGVYPGPSNTRGGTRYHSQRCLYRAGACTTQSHHRGGVTVDRIEIHNGRAFAVRVVIDGVVQTIESRLCLVSSGERSDCSKSKRVFVRP